MGQERTRSGPGAHQEWVRSAPGVGQERNGAKPGTAGNRGTARPERLERLEPLWNGWNGRTGTVEKILERENRRSSKNDCFKNRQNRHLRNGTGEPEQAKSRNGPERGLWNGCDQGTDRNGPERYIPDIYIYILSKYIDGEGQQEK